MISPEQRVAFIRANTEILSPPLVPEIKLHLAHEAVPLWQKTEEQLGELGLPPPFWAFAWAGGQALARYVLDNPEIVRGRRIIDLASGSGLVGLAAMKAGATSVLAADIDEYAVLSMELNAEVNRPFFHAPCGEGQGGGRSDLEHSWSSKILKDQPTPTPALPTRGRERDVENFWITSEDLLQTPAPTCDLILVGDLFYEKFIAEKLTAWLVEAGSRGIQSLIGDPGRNYLPKDNLEKLAEYNVPVTRDLEDAEIKRTAVWTFKR